MKKNLFMIMILLYVGFTAICAVTCFISGDFSSSLFQIWLLITNMFRFALSITWGVLIIRLLHLNRLKTKLIRWKE